ncbi:MAG: exosome complex RNA-binding protein Rrp4 [Candidatus Woesearchaeota archaeon]
MGTLLVEEKSIVVPGEILAQGMDYIPGEGTYRMHEHIYAQKMGLLHVEGRALKIVPLSGAYVPKVGDVIVGKIVDINIGGWVLDINSAYRAMLSMKEGTTDFIRKGADLTRYYNLDDYVVAKIINVTPQFLVDVSMIGRGLNKLSEGRIVFVNAHKVPRIIGKQGSMVSMIKEATNCKIIVGQNGIVWIKGEPEQELIAIETINMITQKAHKQGLTDMVKAFLEEKTLRTIELKNTGNEIGE